VSGGCKACHVIGIAAAGNFTARVGRVMHRHPDGAVSASAATSIAPRERLEQLPATASMPILSGVIVSVIIQGAARTQKSPLATVHRSAAMTLRW
jgi:hypothetical protein